MNLVPQLGQQLVHSSLLFEGQEFHRFSQLWMHPIVSAATASIQHAQLGALLRGKAKEALGLLAWYGAHEVMPFQTASGRSQTVCEAAAAAVLPMPGQLQFLDSVRQAVRRSSYLAALWVQFPKEAKLLLSSLARTDAPSVKRVSYGLLQQGKGQLQVPRDSLPIRQAVCLL